VTVAQEKETFGAPAFLNNTQKNLFPSHPHLISGLSTLFGKQETQ
jgi:hypothetical protein